MKSGKNIVFLGMMGSGKSSTGKLISRKLKLDFFDIDRCIEKKLNLKIAEIFKIKGEEFFREIEEKLTLNILNKKNSIVALGGGAFLNKRIRDEIIKNHISFWLKWNDKTIIKRIKNNPKRPIAFKATSNELVNLIKKRSKIYSKAMYHIDCDNLSENNVVKKVISVYENN